MGRSRGGLTTKVHAVVDANGLPIGLALSEGQAYDGHSAPALLDSLAPGSILLADRAYDADKLRAAIASKGAFANIPPMPQRTERPAFSPFLHRYRNLIERFFNKLKHFRAVATRYDKRDDNFLASIQLASIRIWLRFNESVA
jgi:transposase